MKYILLGIALILFGMLIVVESSLSTTYFEDAMPGIIVASIGLGVSLLGVIAHFFRDRSIMPVTLFGFVLLLFGMLVVLEASTSAAYFEDAMPGIVVAGIGLGVSLLGTVIQFLQERKKK